MSIEKSIGWTDITRNPIKGKCLGGCWYCYYSGERGMIKRFQQDEEIRLKVSVFNRLPKAPKKIFLCSTHDLFGGWIPEAWRDVIFEGIKQYPQHTFQILTKFPQNIDRPMPDNVWLGVSITGNSKDDFMRASYFGFLPRKAKIQFISYEPLLEMPSYNIPHVDWIIIGKLTGYDHKYDPKREWIEKIISSEEAKSTPIFLKDNLKEIWGEPLIQEMPKTTQEKAI